MNIKEHISEITKIVECCELKYSHGCNEKGDHCIGIRANADNQNLVIDEVWWLISGESFSFINELKPITDMKELNTIPVQDIRILVHAHAIINGCIVGVDLGYYRVNTRNLKKHTLKICKTISK